MIFGKGTHYYCFASKSLQWEICIARPVANFSKWLFPRLSFNKYKFSKLTVIEIWGFTVR